MHERFFQKVDKTNGGCWVWRGAVNNKGYGIFNYCGVTKLAHRVSWEFAKGRIPICMNVLHKCDTPRCVNPEHLFLGTQKDNMQDCSSKNRIHVNWPARCGEKHGRSKLTEKQVKEIFRRRTQGEIGTKLATEFGVSRWTILQIVSGRAWKYLNLQDGGVNNDRV